MQDIIESAVSKNDKYRINVYYDKCPMCPCADWGMVATFLFCWKDSKYLHDSCNWKELFGDARHTMKEALMSLVSDYVSTKNLVKYIKDGNVDNYRMRYDNSDKMWYLENYWDNEWYEHEKFEPSDLKSFDYTYELTDFMEEDDLIDILQKYGKDIVVKEFSLTGHCQGDYIEGVAFVTKERYEKYISKDMKKWQIKAEEAIDEEVEYVNRWMWGDVYGYVLEEKKCFTKTSDNGDAVEEFEWEEVESYWGFFCEPSEIIKENLPNDDLGMVG